MHNECQIKKLRLNWNLKIGNLSQI